MTPSELKYQTVQTEPYFFDRKTMKFFGDSMRNYGVRSAVIKTREKENVEVWELYRKSPVKHGLVKSAYFDKQTFKRVFREEF